MTLKSEILSGSARLERAASGGPSVTMGPPADEPDAVKRIQKVAPLGMLKAENRRVASLKH